MKNLESYGMALAACVVSIIPCYWNCCIFGMPFGIWGLVVLLDTNVKSAFPGMSQGPGAPADQAPPPGQGQA